MRHFLLVDDEVNVVHALQRTLQRRFARDGLRIECHTDPNEALARARDKTFDVIMSDYRMPQMTGLAFLQLCRAVQPDAVRLILSASTEFDTVMTAVNEAEVFRYIAKPWHEDDLEQTIRLALVRRDQVLEDRRLADELRTQRGAMTPQEREARRLEEQEPGITHVRWGPDGSVLLED